MIHELTKERTVIKVFRLNLEKFASLASLRGWKYLATELAKATGFSRTYVGGILEGKEPLTATFMVQYILIAGVNFSNAVEWGSLFIVDEPVVVIPKAHQKWNIDKFHKRVPYQKRSLSASFRRQDGPVEEEPENYSAERRFQRDEKSGKISTTFKAA